MNCALCQVSSEACSVNPKQTAIIRAMLDEFLPAVLRENRLLMSLLFRLWYNDTDSIEIFMDFKEKVHSMTEEEYLTAYLKSKSRGSSRKTDAFEETLEWIMARIDPKAESLLDVGCGNGYWLEQ